MALSWAMKIYLGDLINCDEMRWKMWAMGCVTLNKKNWVFLSYFFNKNI
jgi:hypothetical protein